MRNRWMCLAIVFMPLVLGAQSVDFVLPEFEHPYYRMVVPFEV
jgi:hypothetical protein